MSEETRLPWARVVAWVPLSGALIACAIIGTNGLLNVKGYTVRSADVTGSAKRRITSDLAEWESRFATENADWQAGYRDLAVQVQKGVAWLKAQGVKDEELRVSSSTREELFDTQTTGEGDDRIVKQVRTGWRLTQGVTVRSGDVAKLERLSREVTSLNEQGVPVDSTAPRYFYTKLGDLKIEMLGEAAKDARTRVERMVASAGGADGLELKLKQLDMGVINVNPANKTQTSWDGNNDSSSLEKDIITIVHCTFELR